MVSSQHNVVKNGAKIANIESNNLLHGHHMQTGDFEFKNPKGPPVVRVSANQPQFGIQNCRKHTRAEPSYHMHIFDSFKYF